MRKLIVGLVFFTCLCTCQNQQQLNVLILSGSNNHDWKVTSDLLRNIYLHSGFTNVDCTENPDTLTATNLHEYDVLVSNWNSWPQNDLRWPLQLEQAILEYVEQGGGLVTFHASSSAFYDWPEFREISTASWEEETWHGRKDSTLVKMLNDEHPVTAGLDDFVILDELWMNARKNSEFEVLGSAENRGADADGTPQDAIMVLTKGKGRVFHTILGHDTIAMENEGFKALMLRGTEWAATGKVKMNRN